MADYKVQLDQAHELIESEDFKEYCYYRSIKSGVHWTELTNSGKWMWVKWYKQSRSRGKWSRRIDAAREKRRVKRMFWGHTSGTVNLNNKYIYSKNGHSGVMD